MRDAAQPWWCGGVRRVPPGSALLPPPFACTWAGPAPKCAHLPCGAIASLAAKGCAARLLQGPLTIPLYVSPVLRLPLPHPFPLVHPLAIAPPPPPRATHAGALHGG
jgi:hypothetical protein